MSMSNPRWKHRPQGSTWGDFGPNDQLGELWHLTPLAHWLRAHQRHHFLLTAPPLHLPGAVATV